LPSGQNKETIVREYTIILEPGLRNWSAYVPDLPGCVAAGTTREETQELLRDAIIMHIEALQEDGLPVPEPTSEAGRVIVPA
jgi:predicted RNase H-like HicB family nuclease